MFISQTSGVTAAYSLEWSTSNVHCHILLLSEKGEQITTTKIINKYKLPELSPTTKQTL